VILFSLPNLQVPLGLAVTWTFAFLLTENGRMKHCQVNTSNTMTSPPWFRFPYPLQWGTPVFNWKMAIVMCVVSLISSVDSVRFLPFFYFFLFSFWTEFIYIDSEYVDSLT